MTRRWAVAVAAMVAGVAACAPATRTPDPGQDPLSWEDVRRHGLGDARFAVLVSPYPDKPAGNSRLGLVAADGTTRFLDLEMAAGEIAGQPGSLCAATPNTTLAIDRDGAHRRAAAGGLDPWGGWTRVRADGSCTWRNWDDGVRWVQDGRAMSVTVPAQTPAVGLSPAAMWVRDGDESPLPSSVRLTRVDLVAGRTERVAQWSNQIARSGDRRLVADHALTDLFWHEGRVHWLEEVSGYVGGEDERADIRPGVGVEVHLASVDPRTGRRELTHLLDTVNGLQHPEDSESTAIAAWAMGSGHLHEGRIYTGNGADEIVAVDLATRRAQVVGSLRERSTAAQDVVAAWHGGTLSLLVREESGRVVAEDYDIAAGELTGTMVLSGLDGVLDDQTYLESAAVVG